MLWGSAPSWWLPSGTTGLRPGYGSIAAPAGTGAVLGVAAADSRVTSPTVHVLLRAGLGVLASGETPLGGAVGPHEVVSAPVVALARRQVVEVTGGSALDRLFDDDGYSRVAGAAVLLPRGPTTPETVRELAAAGARAVLVDGPIPAGSLGSTSRPRSPRWPVVGLRGRRSACAGRRRAGRARRRRDGVRGERGARRDRSVRQHRARARRRRRGRDRCPGRRPRHVGSRPQRGWCGALRHVERLQRSRRRGRGGSSAPRPGAAGPRRLRSARSARRGRAPAGCRRRPRARRPRGCLGRRARGGAPLAALGAITEARPEARGRLVLRNVSRRPLVVALSRGAAAAGVTVRTTSRACRAPARRLAGDRGVGRRPGAARSPGALEGVVRAVVGPGARLRIPWSAAVPVTRRAVVTGVALSRQAFRPSDTRPAVLAFVAGRIDGSAERPQILPLTELELQLYRGRRRVGTLVRLRDVLPGRYAFGITGRGPRGGRLRGGAYALQVVGTPVGGGPCDQCRVPFRLR